MTPQDKDRALQRYRNIRHRGTHLSFPTMAPIVPAKTPDELEEATKKALEEDTKDDPEN